MPGILLRQALQVRCEESVAEGVPEEVVVDEEAVDTAVTTAGAGDTG